MKSTPSELISTFRKKIYFTSAIGIILGILGMMVLFFIDKPDFEKIRYLLMGLCLVIMIILWARIITYQEIFQGTPEQVIIKLEDQLEDQDLKSKKYNWLRIFLISFVALGWIVNLISHTRVYLTLLLFALFIGGILYVILEKWMRLTAGFMLQDLKHSMRELTHESPEMPAGQ